MRLATDDRQVLIEKAVVYGWSEHIGLHALVSAANSLMAAGASDIGIGVRITYPPHSDKSKIYTMEKAIKKECRRRKIEFLESFIFENPLLAVPSVTIDGVAAVPDEDMRDGGGEESGKSGMSGRKSFAGKDIVLSKWVGMDGMLQAARERADMLRKRFSPAFIRQIISYEKELSAGKELELARGMGVSCLRQITQGGIFAALWEFSKELGVGLELDMKHISILQETVEVCEYFGLNPYQLASAGSFLFVTEEGDMLKEALLREKIMASVIGRTTGGQGKIIRNGEDVRYIDRPAPDEIWKLHISEE